ncbi:MAG: hypothetical protein KDJ87_07705 [Rhizobiaceae bacterium]|nr:hypothetical protein [Rhizobiaceae bacterium]
MDTSSTSSRPRPWLAAAIAVAIAAMFAAALAGWAVHGTSILFTYAQDGLAWCL